MPYPSPSINPANNQDGLTLLELLLVVTILSGIAWMSLGYVSNNADQLRFEDTRNRLAAIKRGILGDSSRTINGGPEIRGYVADMGSLPSDLTALLARNYCEDPTLLTETDCNNASKAWTTQGGYCAEDRSVTTKAACMAAGHSWVEGFAYDDEYDLWVGWNGPYINATSLLQEYPRYNDGWGNDDAGTNYGWLFSKYKDSSISTKEHLLVQSLGRDAAIGSVGADSLDWDYPPVAFPDAGSAPLRWYSVSSAPLPAERFIAEKDYRLLITDSTGAGGLQVDFGTPSSSTAGPGGSGQLCLKVAYREMGKIKEEESSDTFNVSLHLGGNWTGNPIPIQTFTFPANTYFPLGQMAFGIFTHDTTNGCTGSTYPTAGYPKWTPFTVVPGATLQPLSWKIP